MASGIVRGAFSSVIEKSPAQSSRSCKLRQWAKQILDKAVQGEKEMEEFDRFSSEILQHLRSMIPSIASKYKLQSSKREYLWREFQISRVRGKLPALWKQMIMKLGVNIDDPLLEQSLYQELFEMCLKEYFATANPTGGAESVSDVTFSSDELNVLRYVGGYVARQLLKRYEKKPGEIYSQYVACLGEMAVEGEGDDILSYTRRWMELVNRGGLFPLNDEIERCVRRFLPKHFLSPQNSFQESVLSKIIENDDVQFYWTLLSQDIKDASNSHY